MDLRNKRLLAGATGAITCLAACGSFAAYSASANVHAKTASSGAYQIGFSDSLTGALSAFTKPELAWTKAVFNSVNAAGGIHGHKIQLTALDQGETGSGQAPANVTKLATTNHVSAILGELISNDCSSVQPEADRYQVPVLCQNISVQNLQPVDKYMFVDTNSEEMEVEPQMAFIKKTLLPKVKTPKVAVLVSEETGALAWADKWKADAKKDGFAVTTVQQGAETATSLTPQIAAIVASKPQVVVWEEFPQFLQPLIQALKAAKLNIPVISVGESVFGSSLQAIGDPNIYETEGVKVLNVGASSNTSAQKGLLKALAAQGINTTSKVNDVEGTMDAVGPYMIVAGLQKCGYPCSGAQMAKALESASSTVAGLAVAPYAYSPKLHVGVKAYTFEHWNTSKKQLVDAGTEPVGKLSQS